MDAAYNIITGTVPISNFNKGLAGKIFDEVKRAGCKVVMKNNAAECVLLSPERYVSLMEEVEDAKLLQLAMDRIANDDPDTHTSLESIAEQFGITREELDAVGEVEFE